MILVSPTEPPAIRILGRTSSIPEHYGADLLIPGKLAVQRKVFPDDFLSSLSDGRLYEQVARMQSLPSARPMLVLEGRGQWTIDGNLIGWPQYTRTQLWGILASMNFEFGIPTWQTDKIGETALLIATLHDWWQKEKHQSLKRRPGPPRTSWGHRDNKAWQLHILQSFPGIGVELAERIIDHYGRVPLRWDTSQDELLEISGIGAGKVAKMMKALG